MEGVRVAPSCGGPGKGNWKGGDWKRALSALLAWQSLIWKDAGKRGRGIERGRLERGMEGVRVAPSCGGPGFAAEYAQLATQLWLLFLLGNHWFEKMLIICYFYASPCLWSRRLITLMNDESLSRAVILFLQLIIFVFIIITVCHCPKSETTLFDCSHL